MTRLAQWLIERALAPDDAEYLLGDLAERGLSRASSPRLWFETASALLHLHAKPQPGDGLVMSFLADMRHGARLLRRAPGFTVVAILTLGVAIGATTAIFSVVKPVLIDRLPYPEPSRLMMLWEQDRDGGKDNVGFQTFRDVVDQSRTIASAAAIGGWDPTLTDNGDPQRVEGERVSATYFRTLGVRPAVGRDFTSDEDQPGHNSVVILSHALWQQRYGGDSSLVGRSIDVNGAPMTVAGVMPASFDNVVNPRAVLWRVLGYSVTNAFACRTCRHLRMVARLDTNASRTTAAADINGVFARLIASYPREYASVGALLVPMQEEVTAGYRGALLALAGAVVLVLLIAIANVTNLQLARAVRRREEFAIRAALGAGRERLTRMLLTEGLVLAAVGGAAGVVVAAAGLPALVSRLPAGLPRADAIRLDLPALGVVAAVILCFTMAAGFAVARAMRVPRSEALRSGRRLASPHHRARATLVIGEVSLALMLLVSAGLVARSLVALMSVDLGFDHSHLLTLEIDAVGSNYMNDAQVMAYHDRVRDAVRALPGVVSAGVANQLPLSGNVDRNGVQTPDQPLANPELAPAAERYSVSPDYLATMRIPVLRGHAFSDAEENDTATHVTLVSRALAERLWPGKEPIGRQVSLGGRSGASYTVIGLVGNVKHESIEATASMQLYVPERQWFRGADNPEVLVVRTTGDPARAAAAVRGAIRSIDPSQPIADLATMDQVVAASTSQRHLALVLFGAFAGVALLLATAGIYGVLAGSVAERLREIGLRAALGATPADIMRLIVGQGTRLALAGVVLGTAGALAVTRYLSSLLYAVQPGDPLTFVAVIGTLVATAVCACAIPAWRATRVDPSTTLRAD